MIAAVILTYNEEEHIVDCIASVKWADKVVVFDSFSTDDTVNLSEQAGAEVLQHPFENYGTQRNAAMDALDAEWVFFIDADERCTMELAAEIRAKVNAPGRVSGWYVPRHNYIFGKLTLGAGWYPDYQMRLLHRTSHRFTADRPVHEQVHLSEEESGYLENVLIHHNYHSVAQFHEKQHKYTDFEAGIRYGAGERPKPWTYLTMPLRQFWWRFVALKGWRDGFHGLRLSLFMAYYEYLTWRRVARLVTQGAA